MKKEDHKSSYHDLNFILLENTKLNIFPFDERKQEWEMWNKLLLFVYFWSRRKERKISNQNKSEKVQVINYLLSPCGTERKDSEDSHLFENSDWTSQHRWRNGKSHFLTLCFDSFTVLGEKKIGEHLNSARGIFWIISEGNNLLIKVCFVICYSSSVKCKACVVGVNKLTLCVFTPLNSENILLQVENNEATSSHDTKFNYSNFSTDAFLLFHKKFIVSIKVTRT